MGLETPCGNSSPRRIPKLAWVVIMSLWTKPGAGHFTPINYHYLEQRTMKHWVPCPWSLPWSNPIAKSSHHPGLVACQLHTHIPYNNCSTASPLQVPSEKGLCVCLGHSPLYPQHLAQTSITTQSMFGEWIDGMRGGRRGKASKGKKQKERKDGKKGGRNWKAAKPWFWSRSDSFDSPHSFCSTTLPFRIISECVHRLRMTPGRENTLPCVACLRRLQIIVILWWSPGQREQHPQWNMSPVSGMPHHLSSHAGPLF